MFEEGLGIFAAVAEEVSGFGEGDTAVGGDVGARLFNHFRKGFGAEDHAG
jgi:hypothetical protein